MKIDMSDWIPFPVSEIFELLNGKGITKEEIENNPGEIPAIQSGSDNNGCIGKISEDYCLEMNYVLT